MTDGKAEASMLDDLGPRPIFIDSRDLHSCWRNTAAIEESGTQTMDDPVGGKIHRDVNGLATGLLSEAVCVFLIWPHLAKAASLEGRKEALRAAISSLNEAGCTGIIDMAKDDISWDALCSLREEQGGSLSVHIAAHWFVKPTDSTEDVLAQVDRAISLSERYSAENSPDFKIVGIKLMCDGVIDSCTPSLLEPYTSDGSSPKTVWTPEALGAVVKKANNAGLQCALHATGDGAVKLAIDALFTFGTPGRRHRIEHLEVMSPGDAARLAAGGITASIQPVHPDPAVLKAWPTLLGKERYGRAFAYHEFSEAGANVAIGSDAPTALWDVLRNIYIATTRRSAREPESTDVVNIQFALSLCEAVMAATRGGAYSYFAELWTGSLTLDRQANFVVVQMDWDAQDLLKARVCET